MPTINGKKYINIGTTENPIYKKHLMFSSGWTNKDDNNISVANSALLNFRHDLGTTNLNISCYVAEDENGYNSTIISSAGYLQVGGSFLHYGAQVQSLDSEYLNLKLGKSGYPILDDASSFTINSFIGRYIKIVAISQN